MKRILIIISCFFLLTGCGNQTAETSGEAPGETPAALSEFVQEYLRRIGADACHIVSYDRETIMNTRLPFPLENPSSITVKMADDEFSFLILRSEKKDEKAEKNDFISLQLHCADPVSHTEKDLPFYAVASENGKSFPELQKELLGKELGFKGKLREPREGCLKSLPPGEITYTINHIFHCEVLPSNLETMRQAGLETVCQFYDYLLTKRLKEDLSIRRFQFKQDCLSIYLPACMFDFSADQIEEKSESKIINYKNQADSMGLSLEDFWKDYRKNPVIGAPLGEDPYIHAVQSTQREVGTVLFVGVMAKELGLSVSDEEVRAAFENSRPGAFGTEMSYMTGLRLRYRLLEDKVIAALNPEYAKALEGN